jgi:tRNA pseudouridine38-40 synthase
MRYALKVYYDGKSFFGSQIQPGVRTVEGELIEGFEKLGIVASNFQRAGRTDKGVSALGNVFAVTTNIKISPRMLNSVISRNIRVYGIREVSDDFNPRNEALERVYKYFLYDEGYDLELLKKGIKVFEGIHSFHNFCVSDKRNPIRRINKADINKEGEFFVVTLSGKSFLWQMVRRIMTALKKVGNGEITLENLKMYFNPEINKKIPPSGPEGLILWDIRYPFEFNYEKYSLDNLTQNIFESKISLSRTALIDQHILDTLSKLKK